MKKPSSITQAPLSHDVLQSERHPVRRRLMRVFFTFVLLVGVACLLYPVVTNIAFQMGAYNMVSRYDAQVAQYGADELQAWWDQAYAYNAQLNSPEVRDPFSEAAAGMPLQSYHEALNPDKSGMMGVLEVPSAAITLPVYHGTSDEVLQQAAGHLATTALPIDGNSTHAVITGHTGLPNKLLFTDLMQVQQGDFFRMRVLDKTFAYRVVSVEVVDPSDTTLLQPVLGKNILTLVTCTPYGVNSHRLLVTGELTHDPAALTPSFRWPVSWTVGVVAVVASVGVVVGLWLFTRKRH